MKKQILQAFLVVMTFTFMCGCASSDALMRSGTPHPKYLVGGGSIINYEAPSDGTVYWVEETTTRVLATQTLKKGKVFDLDASEPGAIERRYGIPSEQAKLTLYFIPKGAE
jgi:hypothetical protein